MKTEIKVINGIVMKGCEFKNCEFVAGSEMKPARMNKKLKKEVIKTIVNNAYQCDKYCPYESCVYNRGSDKPDGICNAGAFANGVEATLRHLASIPWDEAMRIIVDTAKEDKR